MQAKHLIIIAIVGIVALLAFNLLIGSERQAAPVQAETTVVSDAGADTTAKESTVIDKPLAQQPKAMVDKASDQIAKAEQLEADKMAQMDAAQ